MFELALWLVLIGMAVSTAIKLVAVVKWKRMSAEDKEKLARGMLDQHEKWKSLRR